jgi:VanZ like protein/concanavalin A-like lectin/glucanase superfamily protein
MISPRIWKPLHVAACVGVLCVILTAGLWPFNPHLPNNVAWQDHPSGLRFGGYGAVLSSRPFPPPDTVACSMEIWAEARPGSRSGTLLGFHSPETPAWFSIRQYETSLVFERTLTNTFPQDRETHMVVEAFHPGGATFVALTATAQARAAYVDGALVEKSSRLDPFCSDLAGWLVIGTSPVSDYSWQGTLRGLAVFSRELSAAEVLEHFRSWTQNGRPDLFAREDARALYLFDERGGGVVHNRAGGGPDLMIPDHYVIPDKPFLKVAWKEFEPTWDYGSDVLINIGGFIPLGLVFCAYFSLTERPKRARWLTILLGFLVSLTIETLQAYLPTRESGTTDLITNTLGTALGTLLFRWPPLQSLCARLGIPVQQ